MADFFMVNCCYNCKHWDWYADDGRFEGVCRKWADCDEFVTEVNDCCEAHERD